MRPYFFPPAFIDYAFSPAQLISHAPFSRRFRYLFISPFAAAASHFQPSFAEL